MLTSKDLAKSWIKMDPNPLTIQAVQRLLTEDGHEEELNKLFPANGKRIGFGTAGLRSTMMPGPLGMNDLVVIQATQGLARYVQEMSSTSEEKRLAVVGYDHRFNPTLNISSESFALLTALVFEEAGFECLLLDGYVPTPLVAFATKELKAHVGIMITASHNPKEDAGYKVYWSDGCQIRPPLDSGITESILKADNLTPWVDYAALLKDAIVDDLKDLSKTQEMADLYFDALKSSALVIPQHFPEPSIQKLPRIVYTAMHGVGHPWAVRAFKTFGLNTFISVPQQEAADPEFPTLVFPNPEEKGALNLAKEFAVEQNCDLVFANDPDADRLAVAEKCRKTGSWTVFTGDQIGTMLGYYLWEKIGKTNTKPTVICASTVSSKMLSAIAHAEGFLFEETLTGFKWIASRSRELQTQKGYIPLFCYEEAIGFCCGEVVNDKDGLSAMGVMAKLANEVYQSKIGSLKCHMQHLYKKYGYFCSKNGYFFVNDPEIVNKILTQIRSGGEYFAEVGSYKVKSIRDLGDPGYDSTTVNKKPTLAVSKSSPMITICFENGCVAQFRGSGTEPKLKYYIELRGKPGVDEVVVEQELEAMSKVIIEELLKPDTNGLAR